MIDGNFHAHLREDGLTAVYLIGAIRSYAEVAESFPSSL